jgi:3-phosphoshikimate 1-carboxyvinyltransferase
MDKEKLIKPGVREGCVLVPSSKSIAHREIIAAFLSSVQEPVVRGESNDTLATKACLKAMKSGTGVWPCGESGSTLRFLEPLAGVLGFEGEFLLEGRLKDRPRMLFEDKEVYEIKGDVSSQFISGLLMALPLAKHDSVIKVVGKLESRGYVDLTLDVLKAAKIRVEETSDGWKIFGNQRYAIEGGREVEGDWSQAAFFLAMKVRVDGLNPNSKQGDRAVIWLLEKDDVDASMVPDLIPALAAHAAIRTGETRFFNCARLRLKESDRLESTCRMVNSAGGSARIVGDDLIVSGKEVLAGGRIDTFSDHRIAMASTILATKSIGPIVLNDATVISKSYPRFWDDFESLHVKDSV